jgi:hypothetical protein
MLPTAFRRAQLESAAYLQPVDQPVLARLVRESSAAVLNLLNGVRHSIVKPLSEHKIRNLMPRVVSVESRSSLSRNDRVPAPK